MASAGTVSVNVQTNIAGFEGEFASALYVLAADQLLHQFLQWMDRQGLLQDGVRPDPELAHQFIKSAIARRESRADGGAGS